MEDTSGFPKLIADPATGQLLGAHIIGPQAPTLIQLAIQAMSFGQDVRSPGQRPVLDTPRHARTPRERPAEAPPGLTLAQGARPLSR